MTRETKHDILWGCLWAALFGSLIGGMVGAGIGVGLVLLVHNNDIFWG
jgi:hypothetical protein